MKLEIKTWEQLSRKEINDIFGVEIADLVSGLTKINKYSLKVNNLKLGENYRKLLLAATQDLRVILIKLADRLHNMRTLNFIEDHHKKIRISLETLEIYAPLAQRLGMKEWQDELEDLAFRTINPEARNSIVDRLLYLNSQDENIVDVTVSVQYQIADPQKYVLDIRDADASLVQATESALRHVVGGSIMDDALTTGRELIAQEVKTRLQRYLDKYNTGLEVVIVNIEDSSPPNQVQEAFDDVIKAREDEVRARNEAETYANGLVPEARGQAQRMLQDAEAYKEQVVSEAEGDATRFNLLLAEYQKAPDVTRNRLYLDSIQGVMSNSTKVMIDVEGGNNILYLPLDKIAESTRGIESLNMPSSSNNNTSIRDLTNQVIEEIRRRNRQEERR